MRPTRSLAFGRSNAVARPIRLDDRHPHIAALWRARPRRFRQPSGESSRSAKARSSASCHELEIRMARSFLSDDPLFVLGKLYSSPSHRPPPCGATHRNDLLADLDTDVPETCGTGNVSFSPLRSIFTLFQTDSIWNRVIAL